MNTLTVFPAMPARPSQSTAPHPHRTPTVRPGTTGISGGAALASVTPLPWSGARWVGSLDTRAVDDHTRIMLARCGGFTRARLLIREDRMVRGYADVPVHAGHLDLAELREQIRLLPPAPLRDPAADLAVRSAPPSITVVVCTRDRADQLRDALRSILASDYHNFTVVVVDNAPATSATRDLIDNEFDDPRLRLVHDPVPGLAHARNTGLQQATGSIVAFTDDDVVVDPGWQAELAAAFARHAETACVSGLVPTGELTTPVHGYFDRRVSWARNLRIRDFSLARPPADLPLFPFSVGAFGTGANFALRRTAALALGGFDTAFGAGTRTGGGEDLDMFTRILLAGHTLTVQPSAIVWHRHRGDLAALRAQALGYGTGLGAWLTKIMANPRTARQALRRGLPALARLGSMLTAPGLRDSGPGAAGPHGTGPGGDGARRTAAAQAAPQRPAAGKEPAFAAVRRLELAAVARGPVAYLLERRRGAGEIGRGRPEPARHAPARHAPARSTQARPGTAIHAAATPAALEAPPAARPGRQASGTAATPAGARPPARPARPGLACVVLAHTDPVQVRRLIDALDPFPVFLHVDAHTPDSRYRAMLGGPAERCTPLRRIHTGWARWENVVAEIEGYRAALATTDASHVMLLSGTDYPLAPAAEIRALLAENLGRSFAYFDTLPHPRWGQGHGFSRLRYRHWVLRKHMLRLPVPRRLPAGIVFAGGSQMKILSREHARIVVDAYDNNPRLVRFWRHSWIPDETFVPSILSTPSFAPEWGERHVATTLWWIDWGERQRKSPPWLGSSDTPRVLSRKTYDGQRIPAVMARKFSTEHSTPVLDAIDRELLHRRPTTILSATG